MHTNSRELLIQNIQSKIEITDSEEKTIHSAFQSYDIKKKKDLIRRGEICKNLYFVNRGCLRSYSIDQKGGEHIYQIALENHWIADLYGFLSQTPSTLCIEALEDSDLRMITYHRLEQLYLEIPKLERFFRILFQNAYLSTLQRLNNTVSQPADVRYQALVKDHPDLLQRVPLIYIASYLGITPESLSRIRRKS